MGPGDVSDEDATAKEKKGRTDRAREAEDAEAQSRALAGTSERGSPFCIREKPGGESYRLDSRFCY